jgi:hypothetical protein
MDSLLTLKHSFRKILRTRQLRLSLLRLKINTIIALVVTIAYLRDILERLECDVTDFRLPVRCEEILKLILTERNRRLVTAAS